MNVKAAEVILQTDVIRTADLSGSSILILIVYFVGESVIPVAVDSELAKGGYGF